MSLVSDKFAKAGVEVKDGDWFTDVVERAKCAMKAINLSARAHRVHHALGLCAMAFQQELAVIEIRKGEFRPATPTDIAKMTGDTVQNVWHGIEELKIHGLADHDGRTKGKVRLYAWAIPRKAEISKIVVARDNNPDLPETLISAFKLFKINIPDDFCIARDKQIELERKAKLFAETKADLETSLRAAVGQTGIRARNKKVAARDGNASSAHKNGLSRAAENAAVSSQSYFSDTDTEIRRAASSSSSESARPTTTTSASDLAEIRAALGGYGTADEDAASQMLRDCRAQAAECTASEICEFIAEKGRLARQNPIGFLLTAVPKCFAGEYKSTRGNGNAPQPNGGAFREYLEARVGASLDEYRRISGNAHATHEDWQAAESRAAGEYEAVKQ